MGRALVLALALLAVPGGTPAATAPARRPAARPAAPRPALPARRAARPARPPTYAEAKAAMTALQRDRTRRRYHHRWERAIQDLLRSARGKDAAAATLEAARARYALYRWSANEADREKALILAARATRKGSRDAAALAAAIRREAGEERPARPAAARGARVQRPRPPEPPPDADEEAAQDPALEAALADLSAVRRTPALPLGASDGAGPARVSAVRTWSSDDYTRVAVYLSHWVGWQKLELQPAPDRPRRIALDLRPAVLAGEALARAVPGQRIDRVRAAQNAPDTVRVVLDLPGADGVEVLALDDPPRLVLDVGASVPIPTATSTATSAPSGSAAAAPAAAAIPTIAGAQIPSHAPAAVSRDDGDEEPQAAIRRVVVDAGHGGHDPGAIGPGRVREKDVTLAIAKRLARRLRAAGFEVVLTRRDDRYLALEERTAVANTTRGDLFVSLHANAHPRRNRSGVETYFLNVADDRYAARLAARENGLDLEGQGDVTRILTDLDAKASAGASRRLARLVQREVTAGVRARVGEVRDLGVKSALFYVLVGARMPAVLVETAFISNRDEERRLASARYQEEVAAGVARAVTAFARSGTEVAAARAP
ncbi:MAG TPA: N-acetylmuramoyl-L-alanine amidase [Anaeromyxobacter sp.]|nr:N-acetylmuramoyl-L-alanine amidase [Anaeromyxobacter sp.]